MDNLKKPEVIISGANAVGLVVVTAYFYKSIGELNNEIVELKKHLGQSIKMTTDLQKQSLLLPQIPPVIEKFKNDIDSINKQQRRLLSINKHQNNINHNLSEYCTALNKNLIALGAESVKFELDIEPVSNSNNRNRERSRAPVRKNKRRAQISDDDDDDDFDDMSYNQPRRRNKNRDKISEDEDDYDDDDDDDDNLDDLIRMVKKGRSKASRR